MLAYPIIAVGDLHGQLGWLNKLLAKLERLPEWPAASVVFLGDLVDRGPDVTGTVERVMGLLAEKGGACVMGNHDLALVRAAGLSADPPGDWPHRYRVNYDHEPTFRGYVGRGWRRGPDWAADLAELRAAMPAAHREFLAGLPWVAEAEGYVFLHNGLSPSLDEPAGVQLELLRRRRWDGFVTPRLGTKTATDFNPAYPVWLGADKTLSADPLPLPGRVQVTGHTRVSVPEVNAVRIRLDTSGGTGEPLTACLLRGPAEPPAFVTSDG